MSDLLPADWQVVVGNVCRTFETHCDITRPSGMVQIRLWRDMPKTSGHKKCHVVVFQMREDQLQVYMTLGNANALRVEAKLETFMRKVLRDFEWETDPSDHAPPDIALYNVPSVVLRP
jgi:hypothetical protein